MSNPPHNKGTWQNEINWLRNTYFPQRGNLVLDQLRFDRIYTNFAAPAFSQHGGMVEAGYQLTITAGEGTIYYTTDGTTDPRMIGGAVNLSPDVQAYSGPISISGLTTVRARLLTSLGVWSGLVEASFVTPTMPGDYDGNGMVDDADYLVWRSNFGNSVQPGTAADGTGDGIVDAADYVLWRMSREAANPPGALGLGSSTAVSAIESSVDIDAVDDLEHAASANLAFHAVTEFDLFEPRSSTLQVRQKFEQPIASTVRDLLLAGVWTDRRAPTKALNSIQGRAVDDLEPANEIDISDRAWDEVFSTFANAFHSRLIDG